MEKKLSFQLEEYLESIWVLQVDRGQKEVKTGDLSFRLKIKPASVTEVLGKLKKLGLVSYKKYFGVTLTLKGKEFAAQAVRRHRLAERLLVDVVGLTGKTAEDAACGFEHYITPQIARKICVLLKHPRTCPHGDGIPKGECCTK